MPSDEDAIRELNRIWISAVNAGDLPTLLTLIADDVVLTSPGQQPSGRDAFIATFSGAHQQFKVRCESDVEEVGVSGDMAFTRCRDALTIAPLAGGEASRFAGHRLTIWRRKPDGRWLLSRDLHTLLPVKDA